MDNIEDKTKAPPGPTRGGRSVIILSEEPGGNGNYIINYLPISSMNSALDSECPERTLEKLFCVPIEMYDGVRYANCSQVATGHISNLSGYKGQLTEAKMADIEYEMQRRLGFLPKGEPVRQIKRVLDAPLARDHHMCSELEDEKPQTVPTPIEDAPQRRAYVRLTDGENARLVDDIVNNNLSPEDLVSKYRISLTTARRKHAQVLSTRQDVPVEEEFHAIDTALICHNGDVKTLAKRYKVKQSVIHERLSVLKEQGKVPINYKF